jgi:hypothetical protein
MSEAKKIDSKKMTGLFESKLMDDVMMVKSGGTALGLRLGGLALTTALNRRRQPLQTYFPSTITRSFPESGRVTGCPSPSQFPKQASNHFADIGRIWSLEDQAIV